MSRISVDVSSARIPVLQVGYQGENEVTDVLFDISSWITEFGEGVAQLRVKRPGNSEEESYVLSLTITDGIAVWTVSETDTFNKGNGKVQLSYLVGNIVKKAVIYPYKVGKSIVGADNPVDPFDSWIERSKAWAIGETLDGNAVPETDETYQNNAKYYAEQADILGSAQVVLATEQVTLATEKATLATAKANAAAESEANAAASEAAVNGVSTQLTTRMSAIETEQSVQSARMDTFTSLPEGSTSGNAELADIRVGADGTTYDTAGNAVRGQISELKSDLVPLIDEGFEIEYTSIDLTVYEKKQGYYRYDNAQYQNVTYLEHYDIPVQSGDKYKVAGYNSGLSNILLLLDSSGNKVLAYPNAQDDNGYSHEFVVPYNAVRMILGGVVSTLILFNGEYKPKGISEIRDSIGELKYSYMDVTDEVYKNYALGYINRTNGDFASDSSSISSDFQSVNVGDKFKITGFSQFSTCGYAFYDQYKSFISSGAHDNGNAYQFIDYEIIIPENVAFVRFCSFSAGSKAYKVKRYQKETIVYTQNDLYSKLEEVNQLCKKSNVLYGKKLVACGDSFTAGDFTGYVDKDGNTGTNSDAYDKTLKMYKTYPWWIAQRNDMILINEARNGSDFTNVTGSSNPFSLTRYLEVPTDADYITLMFGLNETGLTDEEIGSNTDTTNATLWGAYNIVFEHFMTNMPYAKIGVIIADAWMTERYANAVKQICEYWGVPVLDLKFDTSIPLGIGGRPNGSETAKELRNGVFQVTETNSHPSLKAHEYRSTIIEDWLRRL